MPSDMADEIDPHAAGPLVVEVAEEAERAEVSLELAPEERRGLAASCVAAALRAEEDEVFVWTGARGEWGFGLD